MGFADRLGLAIILFVLTAACMIRWSKKPARDAMPSEDFKRDPLGE